MQSYIPILFALYIPLFLAKTQSQTHDPTLLSRFREWVNVHRIQILDNIHHSRIFNNWLDNDKYITETNARNLSYTLGHNAYSGMNLEEFGELMGFKLNSGMYGRHRGLRRSQNNQQKHVDVRDLPQTVDWRTKGVVSKVRNQQQCGSCWAFSAVSTLESAVAIKTGNLHDLSEQQVVSCAGVRYGNFECNGGFYDSAWDYVKDNGGLCAESDYPYTSGNGKTGTCVKNCTPIPNTTPKSHTTVKPNSDPDLMAALVINPVSIAIEADQRSFQLYKSGIYDDYEGCNSNSKSKGPDSLPDIDHAVVLVGYGVEGDNGYYVLRNSWDTTWGEDGYMRIGRGTKYGKYGMCGVLYDPMYPVV